MFLPGNWHTGMNMLQSIYKLFWINLLKPLRDLLGWKRILKDDCSSYYQVLWLVKCAHDDVSLCLQRSFMSCYYENYKDTIKDDLPANVPCTIAVHLQSFLSHALQSTNEHLKMMVNFTIVLGDVMEFVSVYWSQDSITVDHRYLWFVPIWKILGQVKYLEATWEQMNALYVNFP